MDATPLERPVSDEHSWPVHAPALQVGRMRGVSARPVDGDLHQAPVEVDVA